jgi:hypothetical protein
MVLIRMFLLERIFSQKELCALDDPVPTVKQVMSPEKKHHEPVEMETYSLVNKNDAKNGHDDGKIKFSLVNEP